MVIECVCLSKSIEVFGLVFMIIFYLMNFTFLFLQFIFAMYTHNACSFSETIFISVILRFVLIVVLKNKTFINIIYCFVQDVLLSYSGVLFHTMNSIMITRNKNLRNLEIINLYNI